MPASAEAYSTHYTILGREFAKGRVVPFLGAGVNLCGRPDEVKWQSGQRTYLPSGSELAGYLADYSGMPAHDIGDLLRVSQYLTVELGLGALYEELRGLFNANYPPTSLHRFLASLPAVLRAKGYPRTEDPLRRQFLIVTTNYDGLMERAFQDAGESVHVVSYMADGEHRGKFLHRLPAGDVRLIDVPNQYRELFRDQNPVIVKVHGAIDPTTPAWDSFVITEDHYIDYLTRTDISNLLPVPLPAKLQQSHFLFLGYSLRDWNLRVILHRIWGQQKLAFNSWAIQLSPQEIDRKLWDRRNVDVLDIRLEDYVTALTEHVQALPQAGGGS
jgi:hypothetical protein